MPNLPLLFTVDVDHDDLLTDSRRELSWKSVEQVPALGRLFQERHLPVTWFVRADNQISDVHGSAGHLYDRFAGIWADLEQVGDAFGWHPHLYERTGAGEWVIDADDDRCATKLRQIHNELRVSGRHFSVVRMGELRHGNALMRTLADLGLEIDCSATPGRVRRDKERSYDWEPTPPHPFRPSRLDYRVPGSDALAIVELPLTMIDIQADYDPQPLSRYLATGYRHDLFRSAFDRFVARFESDPPGHIQAVMHPEEVVPRVAPHGLYGFSLDTVARNLDYLLERLTREGISTKPGTVPALASSLADSMAHGGAV